LASSSVAVATTVTIAIWSPAVAQAVEVYPRTAIEPVTEFLHGAKIVDPYRWLEDQDSPRTRDWIREQTAHTRAYFDRIPVRGEIRRRVEELLAVGTVSEVWKVGNRHFFLKRGQYQEQPVIAMREGDSDLEIVLLDLAQEGPNCAVDIVAVSSNGNFIAFIQRNSGEDCGSIHILDVDARRVLPDSLPAGLCGGFVFSAKGDGFLYVHDSVHASHVGRHAVYFHTFGTMFDSDREIFCLGECPNLRLLIAAAGSSDIFVYRALATQEPLLSDFYIHDLAREGIPRQFLEQIGGVFYPFFVGNALFALTELQAPNRRVVAINLEKPQPDNWHTVVPESQFLLEQVQAAGDSLFVAHVEDGATRVRLFDLNGSSRGLLPCPPNGSVQFLWQSGETDTLFYQFSSVVSPPAVFSYKPSNGQQTIWAQSQVSIDASSFEIRRTAYPAGDGTSIPILLVSRKGLRETGPLPTFLTAYGGFGASITPRFTAYATVLLERGCLFAIASVRGGSEFGNEWHEAARRHKKQTAIDDFVAAGEWLISGNLADPQRLATGGGSNAGLLVAAALTQRPDLFRAVLCLGPLLDMLRYHLFDSAKYWVEEFGCADAAQDFDALRAYSPYQNVADGIAYPAVMLVSGDADTRCNPMHARKMTARLQAATSSSNPVLLDYRPKWGHAPAQPLTTRIEALTDRMTFLCNELGLLPEGDRP
jgi:prolyl oligopeptidase